MKSKPVQILMIGELIEPREIDRGEEFAALLNSGLKSLNRRFRPDMTAPLIRTRGIQDLFCVLAKPAVGFDLVAALNRTVWPKRYRFALVAGEITVGLKTGDVSLMDGPVFDLAAEVLERGRSRDLPLTINFGKQFTKMGTLIECAAHLHGTTMAGWSQARAAIVRHYCESYSQLAIAESLNISQQAVSQSLLKSKIKDLVWVEDSIRECLGSFS